MDKVALDASIRGRAVRLVRWLALLLVVGLMPDAALLAADKVSLQLRWDHQFQFAGYYAAKWQGYYAEAGLEVDIRSGIAADGKLLHPPAEVAAGRAEFGIGAADILIARDQGAPLVVLASIFQESAAQLVALASTPLTRPADLLQLRVGRTVGDLCDIEMQAMLRGEGIEPERVVPHDWRHDYLDLAEGRIDVVPGYGISVPYMADQLGIKVRVLRPRDYGIAFYGDTLFTREALIETSPDLVERFIRASLKGWAYALDHRDEVAARIARELPRVMPLADIAAFNRAQAKGVSELTLHPIVPIGTTNPDRWARMHHHLVQAGLVKGTFDPDAFVFDPGRRAARVREHRTRMLIRTGASFLIVVLALLAWGHTQILRRRVRQATAKLSASEERYRRLVETLPDAIMVERGGAILVANAGAAKLLGAASPAALVGCSLHALIDPDHLPQVLERERNAIEQGKANPPAELRVRRLDGRLVEIESVSSPIRLNGEVALLACARDIGRRKRAERELERVHIRLDRHMANTPLAVIEWSPTAAEGGRALLVRRWAGRAQALFGWTAEEVEGRTLRECQLVDEGERLLDHVETDRLLAGAATQTVLSLRNRTRDGRLHHCRWHNSILRGEEGEITVLSLVEDITERVEAEAAMQRLALHDALTGLPNRRMFEDRLDQALRRAQRKGGLVAVMLLDLDQFKTVNDTLGHAAGDRLLGRVAERLGGLLRATDTLARLGGDEFVLVQTDLSEPKGAAVLAARVAAALAAPFDLDGQEVHVGTSIGIALCPTDATAAEELLRKADLALYRAKAEGRNRFVFFLPSMAAELEARFSLDRGLRQAIERGEFVLHYQPIVELASGRTTGVEALIRWRHPEGRLVMPGTFIPVAEALGLIQPIGEWVLREACRQAAAWRAAGQALVVAVNISPAQIHGPRLGPLFETLLAGAGLPPELLEIEITESQFMDAARASVLCRLAGRGLRIAIDDFGTGYSSLAYLNRFMVHKIKIDRCFVEGIGRNPEAEALIRAMVTLGHSLGKCVLAEGIETERQLAFLRELGCDEGQGYLLGRPAEAEAMTRLLAA